MYFLMGKYLWNLYCAESPPILHITWLLIGPFCSEKNFSCRNSWKKGPWVEWFLSFERRPCIFAFMLRTTELEIGHPTDVQMFLTPPNNHENFFKYPKSAHQLFNRMASMQSGQSILAILGWNLTQPQHVKKNKKYKMCKSRWPICPVIYLFNRTFFTVCILT